MAAKGELHTPAINVNECWKPGGLNINDIFSTQDHVAGCIEKDGTATVFEGKGETLSETTNPELECILQSTEDSIPIDATQWTRMAELCKGVRLKKMAAKGELLTPAICVNECLKPKDTENSDLVYTTFHRDAALGTSLQQRGMLAQGGATTVS